MSFDPTAPGTAEETWAADPRLTNAPRLSLKHVERIVVVAAHPDDETLGAGGLIATAHAQGIAVEIVIVTDGAASHPESPTHSPAQLSMLRKQEVTRAIAMLAPSAPLHFLGFTDGHIAVLHSSVREAIRSVLGPVDSSTLLVTTARDDGHRDHRAVGDACAELSRATGVRVLQYPIWLWHWATPDDAAVPWNRMRRLPLDAKARAIKADALRAFATQHSSLSAEVGDEAVLSAQFLEHFARRDEYFVVDEGPEPAETGAIAAVGKGYFDEKYGSSPDPWGFESRWYERRKRAITLAALPREHFGRVLEVGCSIGVLTRELADRCDELLAVDLSGAAVAIATERLSGFEHVTIEERDIAADFPAGPFDLIVFSEVGYYFDRDSLARVLVAVGAALAPGGVVVSCHWRHPVKEYPLTGDFVHHAISLQLRLPRIASHVERDFILEVHSGDGRSVAEQGGLA